MGSAEPKELSRRTIFSGHKVQLELHEIEEPGGRRATREIVRHNGSVAILALRRRSDGSREVLLERNYRYAFGRWCIEIPAGTLDRPGEPPEDCACRELVEETGFCPRELRRLLTIMPSPGILTERLTIFLAEDPEPGQTALEPGELIEILWTPWPEVLRMIRAGEIEDAKTIAAILYYESFIA
jgi:ADP-ribose pyrophosphatase